MELWKKSVRYVCYFALILTAASCKKKIATEVTLPQNLWTEYETGCVDAYTLDTEGNLYTMERVSYDAGEATWFRKYDTEKNLVFSVRVAEEFAGSIAMACMGNGVYFVKDKVKEVQGKTEVCMALYEGSQEDGAVAELVEFPNLKVAPVRIVAGGGRLYLLVNESGLFHETAGYVLEYSLETGELARLKLDDIRDIAITEGERLLLYTGSDKEYSFLLYDIQKEMVRTVVELSDNVAYAVAAGLDEDSIIYMSTSSERAVIYAKLSEMGRTTEIYPMAKSSGCFTSVNGRLALSVQKADRDSVVVVDLSEICMEQREIKYLSGTEGMNDPYGCGFTITRNRLESDKLVLKLLAQDKDFDMIYVNSWFSDISGIRDSGCFYPLNDVPGVKEYLDCCFPYVREAATDENGDVWMLPVKVDIPVMVCATKYCREQGFLFGENMSYEDFLAAMGALNEEERKQTDMFAVARNFMTAYFYNHKSVNTLEFRQAMQAIKEIMPFMNSGGNSFSREYIFKSPVWSIIEDEEIAALTYGADGRVYSLPKADASTKNVATVQGFVVNPRSDNLEQTLQYIATFVAYQRNKKEIPSFFAVPENHTDSYRGSLYKVYENGAITMGVSEDLYAGYHDVVSGTRDLEEYIREMEKKLKIYFGE